MYSYHTGFRIEPDFVDKSLEMNTMEMDDDIKDLDCDVNDIREISTTSEEDDMVGAYSFA